MQTRIDLSFKLTSLQAWGRKMTDKPKVYF